MKKTNLSIILVTLLLLAALTLTATKADIAGLASPIPEEFLNNDTAQLPRDPVHIRALRNVHYASTPERLKRGGYLANGILMCFTCHSPRDWKSPGAPPIDEKRGAGGTIVFEDSVSHVVAPNITPDRQTGAGTWTDDMFARAIREGVGHDGRVLSWNMPWYSFRNLSDEDLASVIVYLRSLPAIRALNNKTVISEAERTGMSQVVSPLTTPVPAPDLSTAEKRGSYLVKLGECVGCHTSHAEYNPGLFGGGNLVTRWRQSTFSANITVDSAGLHNLNGFRSTIHTGKGGTLGPAMPWTAYRNMNDSDLADIYAFLKSMPPVRHFVGKHKPYTKCAFCNEEHGQGEFNKRPEIASVPPPAGSLEKYAGRFDDSVHFASWYVTIEKSKLFAQAWDKAPKIPILFTSDSNIVVPGWYLPMHFQKDANGAIVGIKEETDFGGEYVRKK